MHRSILSVRKGNGAPSIEEGPSATNAKLQKAPVPSIAAGRGFRFCGSVVGEAWAGRTLQSFFLPHFDVSPRNGVSDALLVEAILNRPGEIPVNGEVVLGPNPGPDDEIYQPLAELVDLDRRRGALSERGRLKRAGTVEDGPNHRGVEASDPD